MTILILGLVGAVLAWVGRLLYGTWFNHATHYSVIWGISLILFELRLIDYYRLEPETWIMIGSAWLAFISGSILLPLSGYSPGRSPDIPSLVNRRDLLQRDLLVAIIALSTVALAAVIQHWMILLAKFGSILNVLILGNVVYSLRLSDNLAVGIPYLDSLGLTAALLGGVYTAIRRKFSFVAVMPLLVVIAEGIGLMGRMKILIAVILFLTGYFMALLRDSTEKRSAATSFYRKWAVIGLAVVLFGLAGELVRSKRGIEESIPGAGRTLRTLKTASFITPSIYLYLTVHHGVFNQYLKRDEEHHLIGANTFAPVYRFIAGFGYETEVSQYEKFYSTPVSANSGSYLREIHGDFGSLGIFIVPFLIGLLCSVLWIKYREGGRLVHLVLFAHMLVIVDLSSMIMGTRLGYWLFSLLASFSVAWYIDYREKRKRV
jgi:oligosaccharide repeat unit polymerase